jgi:cysteinyl-tRNA synthetase
MIPLHCRGLQASDRVYYLYQTLADIADTLGSSPEGQAALAAAQAQLAGSSPGGELLAEVQAALADDFNTPLVVAAFSAPLKAANDLLQTKKASATMHTPTPPAAQPSAATGSVVLLRCS